jgi:hypothetical protein
MACTAISNRRLPGHYNPDQIGIYFARRAPEGDSVHFQHCQILWRLSRLAKTEQRGERNILDNYPVRYQRVNVYLADNRSYY